MLYIFSQKYEELPQSPEAFWNFDVVVISNQLLQKASANLQQRVVDPTKCTMYVRLCFMHVLNAVIALTSSC